jgi:hypothetical protein
LEIPERIARAAGVAPLDPTGIDQCSALRDQPGMISVVAEQISRQLGCGEPRLPPDEAFDIVY